MQSVDLEFGAIIVVRKIKGFFIRTKNFHLYQYLERKKGGQRQLYEKLANGFQHLYSEVSAYKYEKFVTPLWKTFNDRAERAFLPFPSFSFLNNGTIMLTMFGGNEFKTEMVYLEKKYKKSELSSLLLEDYVGSPLLIHNKYVTSFNSIRQLYLLTLYFEKAAISPRKISSVVEWGGGYGNMAKLLLRLSQKNISYVLIDTPLFAILQWLYLSVVLGPKKVQLITKPKQKLLRGSISVVPVGLLKYYQNIRGDLFISTWGLSESAKYAQVYVATHDWFGAKHLFLGYQKNSQSLPTAELIGILAKKKRATIEQLPILPNNFFAYV